MLKQLAKIQHLVKILHMFKMCEKLYEQSHSNKKQHDFKQKSFLKLIKNWKSHF